MGAKDKKDLGIHFGLVLAEIICAAGFAVEFYRARAGNTLSWAYVFEWPIFGAYAVYVWRKLLRDGRGAAPESPPSGEDNADALETYNEYLRSVHRPAPVAESRAEASHQARS